MGTSPTFTIITVTYNSARALRTYGRRFAGDDVEWLVVDNASTDESREIAASLGARVIALDHNIGFGAANNVALFQARGEIVGIVNPDVALDVDDLPTLRDHLETHDVLLAPQLTNDDGSDQPNGRGLPTMFNKVVNRLAPDRAVERGFRAYAAPGEIRTVTWVTGAAIFARRSTLLALDGFDESFFVYYEDVDLGLRAARRGIDSVVIGDIRWVHGWAREASGGNLRGWKLEGRSALTFYRKHPRLFVSGGRTTPRASA